jgi:hypothetical protein
VVLRDLTGGWHWAASLRRAPLYVNVPYWPHRIVVIGWGRLSRRARFRANQPCCYRLRLDHCCAGRRAAAGTAQ